MLLDFLEKFGLIPYTPFDGILYKYVSIDIAEKILSNGSMMFSLAAAFNDPFELTIVT